MMTAEMTIDAEEIAAFFSTLFDHPELQDQYISIWTAHDKRSRCFRVSDLDSAVQYAAQQAEITDVYLRTTLLDSPTDENKRGCAKESSALVGLWLDVDTAHPVHKKSNRLPPDEQAAIEMLERFGVAPSLIIHSGHGLHVWTLFDGPWLIDSQAELREAQEFVQEYQTTIWGYAQEMGYALDSTHDLSRLMRIPGCLNHKQEPLPVHVLRCSEARYSRKEIASHFATAASPYAEAEESTGQPPKPHAMRTRTTNDACDYQPSEKLRSRLASNHRLRATWGRERTDLQDDSPNGYDLALANLLVDEGFSDEEIVAALHAHRAAHGDDTDKLFRSSYLRGTLAKARSPARKQSRKPSYAPTDLGNAERLAALHGQDLRYVRYRGEKGEWYYWTGQCWSVDNIGFVQARAKATVREIYSEVSRVENDNDRRDLAQHARRSESNQRIAAMIHLAKSESPIPIIASLLDNKPWLLTVTNGTIDLRTGELREHRRDDYLTRVCDVVYDPDAQCTRWEQFVLEIMGGTHALVEFLQRLMGMCLTGDVSEHLLPIFYGGGRNGKSTFLDVFLDLLGDHAMPAPASLLCARKGGGDHPTDVAALWGKRLVVASESDEGSALKTALVKSLTSDQFIEARFMHQDNFKFPRTHKIILVTNNKPVIRERSDAIWERVKLVPFNEQFTAARADKRLSEKLKAEYPGILAWAVRGCMAWQREQSLGIPPEVLKATGDYEAEEDQIAAFIEDCCVVEAESKVGRKELWLAYTRWVDSAGEKALPQKSFYDRLRVKGFKDMKFKLSGTSTRGFGGLRLVSETAGLMDVPEQDDPAS